MAEKRKIFKISVENEWQSGKVTFSIKKKITVCKTDPEKEVYSLP